MKITPIKNQEELSDFFDEISDTPKELIPYLEREIKDMQDHYEHWRTGTAKAQEARDCVLTHVSQFLITLEGALKRARREKQS